MLHVENEVDVDWYSKWFRNGHRDRFIGEVAITYLKLGARLRSATWEYIHGWWEVRQLGRRMRKVVREAKGKA